MDIRDANPSDAAAACEVLRRSISELCVADHGNDPTFLQRWLSNKTPAIVTSWIQQSDNSLLVAVEHNAILGVGSVTDAGEITLNYVAPEAWFRGVSRSLLGELEARAALRGNRCCNVFSTGTAHRFYQTGGYVDAGAPARKFGMASGYPMFKNLAVSSSCSTS